MKKLIAAVLAVLCLAGCSAKQETAAPAEVTEVPKQETVQEPVETPAEEKPVENFEIEVESENPALPEDPTPGEGGSVAVPVELVEGLVGDAVGYSFQQPVFADYAAADAMNAFYQDLVNGLVDYANGTVNSKCLQDNCVASVYGKVLSAMLTGSELEVVYQCRVEFSNTEDPVIKERTEVWNVETGEVKSGTQ